MICYLDEQHRQDDGQLLRVLTDIRGDMVSQIDKDILITRYQVPLEEGSRPCPCSRRTGRPIL